MADGKGCKCMEMWHYPKRKWCARLEWRDYTRVFSLQVNIFAPAACIELFGWALYFGRLFVVNTTVFPPETKGWVRNG